MENGVMHIVNLFNRLTGKHEQASVWRQNIQDLITAEGGVRPVEVSMRCFLASPENKSKGIGEFIAWYKYDRNGAAVAQQKEEKPVDGKQVQQSLDILTKAVTALIAETKSDQIQETVASKLEDKVDQYIADKYGPIERKTKVVTELGETEIQGVTHEKFETVLKFVSNNVPVYLVGPAGSGKNVLCKQIADTLGLEFYFSNAVTQEYKMTGFTDAYGHYQESQFYKAFTKGGLFMLDEMDASIPEVLIILNAAIANRYFDFPAPIGKVEAHKDFRVVAAGNTYGHGADTSYVGRNTLDAASLDRFAMVEVDYDRRISLGVTMNNEELVDFCDKFRSAAHKAGLQIVVSYRAMGMISKMESLVGVKDLIKSCLVKGLEKDDIHIIRKGLDEQSAHGKYMGAFVDIDKEAQKK